MTPTLSLFFAIAQFILIFGAVLIMCALLAEAVDDSII